MQSNKTGPSANHRPLDELHDYVSYQPVLHQEGITFLATSIVAQAGLEWWWMSYRGGDHGPRIRETRANSQQAMGTSPTRRR